MDTGHLDSNLGIYFSFLLSANFSEIYLFSQFKKAKKCNETIRYQNMRLGPEVPHKDFALGSLS